MIILDTSVLVRFFTRDDQQLAAKAKKLLDSDNEFFVPESVLVELNFVLEKLYKVSREQLIFSFEYLSGNKKIKVSEEAKKAIIVYKNTLSVSIADCFVTVYGENHLVASFDKRLLKISKVKSAI